VPPQVPQVQAPPAAEAPDVQEQEQPERVRAPPQAPPQGLVPA